MAFEFPGSPLTGLVDMTLAVSDPAGMGGDDRSCQFLNLLHGQFSHAGDNRQPLVRVKLKIDVENCVAVAHRTVCHRLNRRRSASSSIASCAGIAMLSKTASTRASGVEDADLDYPFAFPINRFNAKRCSKSTIGEC